MDMISENKLRVIAGEQHRDIIMIEKDYFLTLFLYILKEKEGFYFKGGTALHKIFLNHLRLSEDLDFTITIPLAEAKQIISEIIDQNKNLFTNLTYDKSVYDFTRYLLHYKSYFNKDATLNLDLNKRSKLLLKPEQYNIQNFYDLKFKVPTLNEKELIAEKICALINRNRARDYFDVYQFIHKKVPIEMELVKEKCRVQNQEFSIKKIFNNSNKIFKNWEKDLSSLTADLPLFKVVMKTLTTYFNYAEEKEKLRKDKTS